MDRYRKFIQIGRFFIQAFFMAGLVLTFLPRYGMIGKWLFWTILFVGVFFCGWVCPFGSIQDWLAKIARFLKLPRYQVPKHIQQYLVLSRYAFYVLGIAGIVFSILNARSAFNHRLFQNNLEIASGMVLAVFLIVSLFIDRPFCNYFCMKGAEYGILGVLRVVGIKRDNSKCIHCKVCDRNCPMNIEVEKTDFVRHPNCINCMTCVSVCPRKCMTVGVVSLKQIKTNRRR